MNIDIEVSDDKQLLVLIVTGNTGGLTQDDITALTVSTKIADLFVKAVLTDIDVVGSANIDEAYFVVPNVNDELLENFEITIPCTALGDNWEYVYDNVYSIEMVADSVIYAAEEALFALSRYYCDEKIAELLASRMDFEAERTVVSNEAKLIALQWAARYNSISDITVLLSYFEPLVNSVL